MGNFFEQNRKVTQIYR